MNRIAEKIEEIKIQIGIELMLCDYFTGIRKHNGKEYFNVILKRQVWMSEEYPKLLNLCEKGVISRVEPNGVNRLSIFF